MFNELTHLFAFTFSLKRRRTAILQASASTPRRIAGYGEALGIFYLLLLRPAYSVRAIHPLAVPAQYRIHVVHGLPAIVEWTKQMGQARG